MLKAKKGNRVLRIEDNRAEEYRTLGFTVTDMNGHLIATPDNAQQRIRELEQENIRLRAQLSALSTKTEVKKTGKEKQ